MILISLKSNINLYLFMSGMDQTASTPNNRLQLTCVETCTVGENTTPGPVTPHWRAPAVVRGGGAELGPVSPLTPDQCLQCQAMILPCQEQWMEGGAAGLRAPADHLVSTQ